MNYYLLKDACPRCGQGDMVHIGTYKYGWCFALHLHPQDGINSFDDWKQLFFKWRIIDAHGNVVAPGLMISIITEPNCAPQVPHRHDGVLCQSHGGGSWDNLIGDFE